MRTVNKFEIKPLETYTIPTNVTKLSDYCFSNCEDLIEIKGLEHVKEIGKGCFINCLLSNRDQYPQVKQNIEEYLNTILEEQYRKRLEEWTGLHCFDILFDSDVDDWSRETSVLHYRIIGRKQLAFIIEDEDGEIFGYYLNSLINNHIDDARNNKVDNSSFHFNLQSNGRLNKPMKFEIKELINGICLYKSFEEWLIYLGDIVIRKENNKDKSWCNQNEERFNYYGIDKALCGKRYLYHEYFIPKRIFVIQMI